MNYNKTIIGGRLTREVELRTLPNGTAIAKFTLATKEVYKNKDGEKVEESDFHNCCVFGRMAETIAKYAVKGQVLLVTGKGKNRTWEKKDGTKGYGHEVVVDEFEFGEKPRGTVERTAEPVSVGADEGEGIRIEDIPF